MRVQSFQALGVQLMTMLTSRWGVYNNIISFFSEIEILILLITVYTFSGQLPGERRKSAGIREVLIKSKFRFSYHEGRGGGYFILY